MLAILLPLLLFAFLADFYGWLENPYFGITLYVIFVTFFLVAVILLISGFCSTNKHNDCKRNNAFSYSYIKSNLPSPEYYESIKNKIFFVTIFTGLFLFFLGITTHVGYFYTNTNHFCATFCHQIMSHASKTHENSPHSRVNCIECHTGQHSKFNRASGLKQFYKTITKTYEIPLKTPSNRLRPSNETCEKCHWPDKFHGHRLHFSDSFLPDESNSHIKTALFLKIGSGGSLVRSANGVHWHASSEHQLYYQATDDERQNIVEITLNNKDGSKVVYKKEGAEQKLQQKNYREMDCVDCHNRPTHYVFSPERALDNKLLAGEISRKLPFIKKEALEAITRPYTSTATALQGISDYLTNRYSVLKYDYNKELLAQAIHGSQKAYIENVSPELGISWNSYTSFLGHTNNGGCFRCHNSSFKTNDARTIPHDCKLCHVVLAENEPSDLVIQKVLGIRKQN